jgi:ferric-dicitrate binding protein FerR (iron transport regulator)
MNDWNISWNQLVRYLGGEASRKEQEEVRRWMAVDPKHKEFMRYLRQIWENTGEERGEWDIDAAWSRFQEEYSELFWKQKSESAGPFKQQSSKLYQQSYFNNRKKRNSWLIRWGSMAAGIAALVAIMFVAFHSMESRPSQKQAMRHIVCPNGQKLHFRFSDGSQIILNGGSKLTMPKTFSGPKRHVRLSGEAFFIVTHNPRRPFIVYTKHSEIRDLGTRFDVKAYPGRPTQVAVTEGNVRFRSKEDGIGSGMQITSLHKGVLREHTVQLSAIQDSTALVGWASGKLIFNDQPLPTVAERLGRWYWVKVKVGGSGRASRKFTGRFTSGQPLSEVLDAVALSLDMHYTEQDSTIIFYSGNT